MKQYIIVIAIFISSCNNNIKTVRFSDNLFAKGKNISDSLFNGEVMYYDKSGKLLSKSNFINNNRNGNSIIYGSNGKIKDSILFVANLANGKHYEFDDNGDLIYSDYSYFDLAVGPKVFYLNKRPTYFSFSDFDRSVLFSAEYDSLGIKKRSGYPLNFNYYLSNLDGNDRLGLMLYLIEPPLVNIKYHLGIMNLFDSSKKVVITFNTSRVFIDTLLSPPNNGYVYYLQADYTDSIFNDKKIYFRIFGPPSGTKMEVR